MALALKVNICRFYTVVNNETAKFNSNVTTNKPSRVVGYVKLYLFASGRDQHLLILPY